MDIVTDADGKPGRDDFSPLPPAGGAEDSTSGTPAGLQSSPPAMATRTVVVIDDDNESMSGTKSDSEAETVLLPGVNGHSPSKTRKAIKLKDKSTEGGTLDDVDNPPSNKTLNAEAPGEGATSNLGKRKRSKHGSANFTHEQSRNGNSSGLSSVPSSPAANPRPKLSKRAQSESYISKSPSLEPERRDETKRNVSREEDHEAPSADDKEQRKTHRRRSSGVEGGGQENQRSTDLPSTSRAENNLQNPTRSTSPHSYAHRRSASSNSAANGLSHKKKKLPAPLRPTRDTHSIQEISDDDSSAGESPHPRRSRTRNLATPPTGNSSISLTKMAPHKKRNPFGRTPLADACEDGDILKARRLLQEKPQDVDVADAAGNTPLQCASLNGHKYVVKLLLEAGCNINCVNDKKDSPLLDAVENGHLEVVKLLLAAGVNPKIRNEEGEEPINKIDDDGDYAPQIRQALLRARANFGHTQPSAPVQSPHTESYSSRSRRTQSHGRSTKTGEHQLYTSYNVHSLRSAAARGDLASVGNILQVIVTPGFDDPESLVAAARGGHDEVLQILLGFGNADPDPPPLEHKDWEHATPMLAAIGSDNIKVIELLLAKIDDDRFDPTKRYNGSTYHEIARQRMGPLWEEEERILKSAFETYKPRSSVRSGGPNHHGTTRGHYRKVSDPETRSSGWKAKPSVSTGLSHGSKRELKSTSEPGMPPVKRGPGRPRKESSDSPAAAERDHNIAARKDKTQSRRAESEQVPPQSDHEPTKPRRKLISGKDLKGEREKQRRASVASLPSSINPLGELLAGGLTQDSPPNKSSKPRLVTSASDADVTSPKLKDRARSIKKDDPKDRVTAIRADSPAKRPRTSSTPPSESHDSSSLRPPDHGTSNKRRRLESDVKSSNRSDAGLSSSPDRRTTLGSSSLSKESLPTKKMKRSESQHSRKEGKFGGIESHETSKVKKAVHKASNNEPIAASPSHRKLKIEQTPEPGADSISSVEKAAADREAVKEQEKAGLEAKIKQEADEQREKYLLEEARLKRLAAERAEEASRVEKERQAEIQRREEERRDELRKAEEEKKRLYDEQIRLRAEEQERRKAAQREEQRAANLRLQQEREAARLAKLPGLLRWFDRIPGPTTHEFASEFRVMQGVRYDTIRPETTATDAREQWLLNTQVALLLGEKNLQLSQYTAWERIVVSDLAKRCLWKVESERYTMTTPTLRSYNPAFLEVDEDGNRKRISNDRIDEMRAEAMDLFLALDLFFVKVTDFMFIVPKFPHLRNVQMQVQYREIPPDAFYLDKLTFPPKWRQDPDAESNFGFAPGAKIYVNGGWVSENKPKLAQTSKTPFPEQRVPRLGLRQVFPSDPDYEKLCIEQGLEHLIEGKEGKESLINGNAEAVLVNGALMGVTPPESMNGEAQVQTHPEGGSEPEQERTTDDGPSTGVGPPINSTTETPTEMPNGITAKTEVIVNGIS